MIEMENEKYGQRNVWELSIFDPNGNLVTRLDSLKYTNLYPSRGEILVEDHLIDLKLLKFLGKPQENNQSDYEKEMSRGKYGNTISFGKNASKNCSVIAKGTLRKSNTALVHDYIVEVPKATAHIYEEIQTSSYDSSMFRLVILMHPFNDEDDTCKLHI